jgi:hypothetical protein
MIANSYRSPPSPRTTEKNHRERRPPEEGKKNPRSPKAKGLKEEVLVEKAHLPTGSVWNTDNMESDTSSRRAR